MNYFEPISPTYILFGFKLPCLPNNLAAQNIKILKTQSR